MRFLLGVVMLSLASCSSSSSETTTTTTTTTSNTNAALSPAEVELGRLLFWDPILSGDRDVACASCHHPDFAYTDGKTRSTGTGGRPAARNALTILNTVNNGMSATGQLPAESAAPMFWDNRVQSLETQATGPLTTLEEMRGPSFTADTIFPELVTRLAAIPEYVTRFGEAGISEESITHAIATFERTLVDTGSSYDRSAMTAQQQHGLAVLQASGCTGCHAGPMFSDYTLHELGGPAGTGRFRTPSLRNVARTAPYLQDGSRATLDAMFDLYRQVDHNADPKLQRLRVPTGTDRDDVIAFLGALSDGDFDRTIPERVPSGLTVGGVHP